ncbi:hypothetical protein G3I42_05900 [Streptomyces sp. SID11385]|nr:hypothetical protein [Streptomyces sp. SID11385]
MGAGTETGAEAEAGPEAAAGPAAPARAPSAVSATAALRAFARAFSDRDVRGWVTMTAVTSCASMAVRPGTALAMVSPTLT